MREVAAGVSNRRMAIGWLAEIALVAAVATAINLTISVAVDPLEPRPDALAYTLGFLIAAALPARRRWPLGVLAYTIVALLVYYAIGYPGISPVVPLAVPLYCTARAGRMWWAVAGSALFMSAGLGFLVFKEHVSLPVAASTLLPHAALQASLILLGETRRSRFVIAEKTRLDAVRAALDQEREFARRAAEERLRIARELHDVLAHTLAGAAVQAAVAADTLADDPAATRTALDAVRASCREARAELSATLGLLRADRMDSDSREPVPDLAQLDTLLDSARSAGLRAELTVEGEPHQLPSAIELTAYRIVQEALTNVMQHANAETVHVTVAYRPDGLRVSVSDDGRGDTLDHAPRDGHGLVGMRERVAAVGGTITARGRPHGGFDVVATLHTPVAAGEPR